ncbi:two pore domain potassium channel family protein [Vibrio sp. S17_S38]|nr:two pore domain potassium channel family protein [Vibrio sp. S17_S38]
MLQQLHRWFTAKFNRLSGQNLLFALLIYLVIAWGLLNFAQEEALTPFSDFIYYIMVTGSTVGYGDMSPQTELGKWITALFIIPGGVGLFAMVVGRLAANAIQLWKARLMGHKKVNVENHILILGWSEERTPHLIEMLLHEIKSSHQDIVLCSAQEIENPFPSKIEFVHVSSFTDQADMQKACVNKAKTIIIDLDSDNDIMAAGLNCANENPNAHIVTYFRDAHLGTLLKQHCKNVECIPSIASEMIAKSAVDPGSSQLHYELVNNALGMTQYMVKYQGQPTSFNTIFSRFKQQYDAILIAINQGNGLALNPPLEHVIQSGDVLVYIADERITNIDWKAFI